MCSAAVHLAIGASAFVGRPETPGGVRPDAARWGASNDLIVWIVVSTFAGTVTRDSSQISVFSRCNPPEASALTPSASGRNPIETPVIRPALIECQASLTRSRTAPGSGTSGRLASKAMPAARRGQRDAADRAFAVVVQQQRERVGEGGAERFDDVAAAIGCGRGRQPGNQPTLGVERLD